MKITKKNQRKGAIELYRKLREIEIKDQRIKENYYNGLINEPTGIEELKREFDVSNLQNRIPKNS